MTGHDAAGDRPAHQRRPVPRAPTCYDLRVTGHLDPHWSTWFGGAALDHRDDGTTVVRCAVADQAELHGLLARVRDLGATLVSVTPVDGGCYLW